MLAMWGRHCFESVFQDPKQEKKMNSSLIFVAMITYLAAIHSAYSVVEIFLNEKGR
jgi:hypothetical protein